MRIKIKRTIAGIIEVYLDGEWIFAIPNEKDFETVCDLLSANEELVKAFNKMLGE